MEQAVGFSLRLKSRPPPHKSNFCSSHHLNSWAPFRHCHLDLEGKGKGRDSPGIGDGDKTWDRKVPLKETGNGWMVGSNTGDRWLTEHLRWLQQGRNSLENSYFFLFGDRPKSLRGSPRQLWGGGSCWHAFGKNIASRCWQGLDWGWGWGGWHGLDRHPLDFSVGPLSPTSVNLNMCFGKQAFLLCHFPIAPDPKASHSGWGKIHSSSYLGVAKPSRGNT